MLLHFFRLGTQFAQRNAGRLPFRYAPAISLFPAGLREAVSWMPFAGMSQNPVLILMMKYDLAQSLRCLALSVAWIMLLELFAKLLFTRAVRKVTVQGG